MEQSKAISPPITEIEYKAREDDEMLSFTEARLFRSMTGALL
jgi:hypothetical protein